MTNQINGEPESSEGAKAPVYVRLPKFSIPVLYVATVCGVVANLISHSVLKYRLDGIALLSGGFLLTYLAYTLKQVRLDVDAFNRGRPPFRRIPSFGKHGKQLCLALGIAMCLGGFAELAWWG